MLPMTAIDRTIQENYCKIGALQGEISLAMRQARSLRFRPWAWRRRSVILQGIEAMAKDVSELQKSNHLLIMTRTLVSMPVLEVD